MDMPKSIRDRQRIIHKTRQATPLTIQSYEYEPQAYLCEGCNRVVEEGHHWEYKYFKRQRAWQTRCVNCKRYKNPFTGEFDVEYYNVWESLQNAKNAQKKG